MAKKSLLAIVAVFIAWTVMDFVIHGLLLQRTYAATAELWRPMADMKMGLMRIVGVVSSVCFVGIYACVVNPKSMGAALRFGLLFGVGAGVSMGYGTYAVMPIPQNLALSWMIGTIAEALVGAVLVGLIVKPNVDSAPPM